MWKLSPLLLLLFVYIIFITGSATFYSFQDTFARQRNIQIYLNNIKDEQQRAVVKEGIQKGTHPIPGFRSSYCYEGLDQIIVITIINLILLLGISAIVAVFVWLFSMVLRKQISLSYKQKILIVGIISLIVFEIIVIQLTSVYTNRMISYRPIFLPMCI